MLVSTTDIKYVLMLGIKNKKKKLKKEPEKYNWIGTIIDFK